MSVATPEKDACDIPSIATKKTSRDTKKNKRRKEEKKEKKNLATTKIVQDVNRRFLVFPEFVFGKRKKKKETE